MVGPVSCHRSSVDWPLRGWRPTLSLTASSKRNLTLGGLFSIVDFHLVLSCREYEDRQGFRRYRRRRAFTSIQRDVVQCETRPNLLAYARQWRGCQPMSQFPTGPPKGAIGCQPVKWRVYMHLAGFSRSYCVALGSVFLDAIESLFCQDCNINLPTSTSHV